MSLRVKLVTLDAMNTLIRLREPVGKIYSDFAHKHFRITADPSALQTAFLSTFRDHDQRSPCYGFSNVQKLSADDAGKDWWMSVVRHTFQSVLGDEENSERIRTLDSLASALYEYFETCVPWTLDPTAASVLEFLRRKTILTAVLSNYDSRLRRILQNCDADVAKNFDAFFLSGEIGLAKPDNNLFRLVEKTMQVDAADILHIGDDEIKDYEAAKKAGWRALLFSFDIAKNKSAAKAHVPDVITELVQVKSKIS